MEKTIKKYNLYIHNFINIIKMLPASQKSFDWILIVVEFLFLKPLFFLHSDNQMIWTNNDQYHHQNKYLKLKLYYNK